MHALLDDLPGTYLARLSDDPTREHRMRADGGQVRVAIAIPHYRRRLERHYPDLLSGGLTEATREAELDMPFEHFGVVAEFEQPETVEVHDGSLRLFEAWRALIDRFGPVILRNVRMPGPRPDTDQRNIFSDRSFHIDRGRTQPNRISMFYRDPSDPNHHAPRGTSTLFVPNLTATLQERREGRPASRGQKGKYTIFQDRDVAPLIGEIILEQPWSAPAGCGEIAVLDNATVVHASYYRPDRGYPIGVRYLY